MKKRAPAQEPLWDTIYPMLISRWRKWMKLPVGPIDRLQTREFRTLIEHLAQYRESKDASTIENLSAYFMYEWPLHYAQGISLLKELPKTPTRVLDVGTLGAPFALAALQHGAVEAFAIGENERGLKCGADLCGHLGYPISIRTQNTRNPRALAIEGKWDLIILSYTLFKDFSGESDQVRYIEELLSLLTPEGHLLIVEDSATDVNRKFLKVRDSLAKRSISILAPCLWKEECPALKHSSSPCFAQRPFEKPPMIKEIQRASKINLSSLKMSYLILRSPLFQPPVLENNLYRVVSPSLPTFRGERYFLCGVKGKKTIGTTLKTHPKHSKAFEYLQRGDVIAIEGAVELESDLQITEKTQVLLKAPCDKPVPS